MVSSQARLVKDFKKTDKAHKDSPRNGLPSLESVFFCTEYLTRLDLRPALCLALPVRLSALGLPASEYLQSLLMLGPTLWNTLLRNVDLKREG